MLHEALQGVADRDKLACHGSGEALQHDDLVWVDLVHDITLVGVLRRNHDLEREVSLLAGWASMFLMSNEVRGACCGPVRVIMSFVVSMQLELEGSDWLAAG